MSRFFDMLKREDIQPEKARWQRLGKVDLNIAGGIADFSIPKDKFIHQLRLRVNLGTLSGGTSPTWNSDAGDKIITNMTVIGDGNKYMKSLTWQDFQVLMIMNREIPTAGDTAKGYNKIYFHDPRIVLSQPLPSWIFTSLLLRAENVAESVVCSGSPTGWGETYLEVFGFLSDFAGQDLTNWRVLVEKYLQHKAFGTATLEQLYEHERTYRIFGWVYVMDDNATLSNTVFDKLSVKGLNPEGEDYLLNDELIENIREDNKQQFQATIPTGYAIVDFPTGLRTAQYTSLKSYLNIPTAGTNIGLRVIERYVL